MKVTHINLTNENIDSLSNYLAINHPGYRILEDGDYEISVDGKRLNSDREFLSARKKTARVFLENGMMIEVPIETLRPAATSIIPVFIDKSSAVHIDYIPNLNEKHSHATFADGEKVISYKNFEIRNGKFHARNANTSMINSENLIIIKG